jgi:YVTN family beta-propeller protein
MRTKIISSASLLSLVLGTILSLSAMYSGVGIAKGDSVIATIAVGSRPFNIAYDSSNGNLYVGNYNDGTISIISGQTNTVIGSPIPVGGFGIAFDSANGNLYATNLAAPPSAAISVISGQTNTVINRIGLESTPEYIAFDSSNNNLYVTTNFQSNAVSVISGQTNTVVGNPIAVGYVPAGITFDPDNGNLYVANHGTFANRGNTVSVISGKTNTVIGTIPVGSGPYAIAFDSANGNLYVANQGSNAEGNTVSVITTTPLQPSHTTITSGVDGNGATITDGSTTFSSFIRFTFTATAGTNPIASFECSLDNNPFSSCSSPTAFNNLAAEPHKFVVVAVDTAGNKDPNPATFSWTVGSVTPTQSIQKLIQLKHSMHLGPAADQTLDIG